MQLLILGDKKIQNDLFDEKIYQCVSFESYSDKDDLMIINPAAEIICRDLNPIINLLSTYPNIGTIGGLYETEISTERIEYKSWCDFVSDNGCELLSTPTNGIDFLIISKEVLSKIETLDNRKISKPSFLKNWFQRVIDLGYTNYVYPKVVVRGEVLYSSQKALLRDKEFNEKKEEICKSFYLWKRMQFNNGRKNVLHYLLADFRDGHSYNVGGTQLHVKDLVDYQRWKYNVFVLARDMNKMLLTEYVDGNQVEFEFECDDFPTEKYFHSEIHSEIYEKIFNAISFDIVHVHHTMWLPLDIFYIANRHNIPLVFTAHDYYFACPELIMMCGNELCTKEICKENSTETKGKNKCKTALLNDNWKKEHAKVLDLCDAVIFPSEFSKDIITSFYGDYIKKTKVIEHGINTKPNNSGKTWDHDRLRIAFLGNISELKGGRLIHDVLKKCNSYDWYIIGGIGYDPISNMKNVKSLGWYKQEDIVDILQDNEIDIVCILSIVNETFCYTLSESIAAGVPVIATDVGALGTRMKQYKCGWLVDRDTNATELIGLLDTINNNRKLLADNKQKAESIEVRDIAKMGEDYDNFYSTVIRKRNDVPDIRYLLGNEVSLKNSCFIDEEVERLRECERKLTELNNSMIIRGAQKLRRVRIPGKKLAWIVIKRLGGR